MLFTHRMAHVMMGSWPLNVAWTRYLLSFVFYFSKGEKE